MSNANESVSQETPQPSDDAWRKKFALSVGLGLVIGAGLGAALGAGIGIALESLTIWAGVGVALGAGLGLAVGVATGAAPR